MDGDAIKRFLAHHIEKFVLGLIAVIAIFLIYTGSKSPDYLAKEQPERLQENARTVRQSIDDDHTEAIVETLPAKEGEDYPERVASLQKPIPVETYGPIIFEPRSTDATVRRQDPQLLAPIDLQVQGVLGALAMQTRRLTTYPAKELEDADPIEVKEEKKPRDSRRSRRGRRGFGGEGSGYGGEMESAEMYSSPEMMGGGPGGEMGGYGAEMGGFGMNARQRRLDPKYNQGYKPTSGTGMAMPGPGANGDDAVLKTVPQSAIFIAGTAAVPHKKLVEAYKAALLDAAGYQAQRDRPIYAGFEVQRADVTAKPIDQLVDEDWVLIGDWAQHNKMALYQWDGFAAEIVPGDYRDPHLTAVIPPLLVYDFTRFATHPLIPLKSLQEIAMEKQPQRQSRRTIEGPILPGAANESTEAPEAGENAFGPGSMVGGMMPGARNLAVGDPEFKLVRFYDFYHGKENSAQPGHDYVYRVRIKLEDPNFPKLPRAQPTLRNLAADVFARVAPKVAEFEASRERDFVIASPWSEPSPVASLPGMSEVLAGPVEPANVRRWDVAGKSIDYIRSPAQGKAVGMQWDWALATNVPAEMTVTPGVVLNTKQAAEVIDPLTMVIKKTEERQIETDITVVDLVGGEPLEIAREPEQEEEMTAPGTMLMFDANGGLYVHDDVEDLRGYRMHTFADEHEAATRATTSSEESMAPGGGAYGEEMGGYGEIMGGS